MLALADPRESPCAHLPVQTDLKRRQALLKARGCSWGPAGLGQAGFAFHAGS